MKKYFLSLLLTALSLPAHIRAAENFVMDNRFDAKTRKECVQKVIDHTLTQIIRRYGYANLVPDTLLLKKVIPHPKHAVRVFDFNVKVLRPDEKGGSFITPASISVSFLGKYDEERKDADEEGTVLCKIAYSFNGDDPVATNTPVFLSDKGRDKVLKEMQECRAKESSECQGMTFSPVFSIRDSEGKILYQIHAGLRSMQYRSDRSGLYVDEEQRKRDRALAEQVQQEESKWRIYDEDSSR